MLEMTRLTRGARPFFHGSWEHAKRIVIGYAVSQATRRGDFANCYNVQLASCIHSFLVLLMVFAPKLRHHKYLEYIVSSQLLGSWLHSPTGRRTPKWSHPGAKVIVPVWFLLWTDAADRTDTVSDDGNMFWKSGPRPGQNRGDKVRVFHFLRNRKFQLDWRYQPHYHLVVIFARH